MSCYLKRGELASVLSTYGRCREALVKGLCASVSSETKQLYLEALHATHPLIVQFESRMSDLPVHRATLQAIGGMTQIRVASSTESRTSPELRFWNLA